MRKPFWQQMMSLDGFMEGEKGTGERQGGKDIAMFGSSDLASTFMRLNLIDEYRIIVNPVVIGRGHPLFKNVERTRLQLVKAQPFRSGNVLLYYQPAPH